MNSSKQDILFVYNIFVPHLAQKDFMGIIPSSIPALTHFILVSTAKIYHFHGSHQQFHIGYCVWNVSLLHLVHKDFMGITPSSIPVFLHFILAFIAVINFHFHGSYEQFRIGYCVWNVSLLHPTDKYFVGIIPSFILAFLHFILASIAEIIFHFHGSHEQFHIRYCL